ncbi:hypothetical protein KR044_007672 [Drosophila immigrans]|nr:hypothetical protein KR044_007672 [Drosophila immigrans]
MASAIQAFYKNKTILITGGSGFIGKVTIEKLLRSTEVKRIYVLLRPKKGLQIHERIADWKDDVVFSVLVQSNPDALKKIVSIAGDIGQPDLGISHADRELLAKEVHVVIHGAATIRFTEPLHVATDTNTRPTRLLLQLAREMSRLEAFIYLSTAFSNCISHHIDERYYPEHLGCTADQMLHLREILGNQLTDKVSSVLVGKFPNTYTFTKALSEQILERESGDLPVSVFRPGVIIASYKEPVEGWMVNPFGISMLAYRSAMGFVRTSMIRKAAHANVVPVDYCVNLLLALTWQTATEAAARKKAATPSPAPAPPPPIYNNVPSENNLLTWGQYIDYSMDLGDVYPLETMKWAPFVQCTTNPWVFRLLSFFYHLLPGYAADLILRLKGEKALIVKTYQKLHKQMLVLAYFGCLIWRFKTHNTDKLWSIMSPKDREVFEFDMASLNWKDYFYRSTGGMRTYLAKEEPSEESLKRARKVRARFIILHHLVQGILCFLVVFVLWKLLRCLL